ncbi:hypothetical protein SAMN02799620_01514 [Mycolicibacterium fluoranthenivorans]|uniref:Uncharacterized protein n=1 Tax=Mycolicibacterium fluoranthenivorans TaxID=258505 RepID=A0A1G4VSD6_9MYCO|nr:hypothetical protein SAMN02799620_01514 [Mycolicibacterium fluoranthenivorans]
MSLPSGTDFSAIIKGSGDVWKQWGLQVLERDGFTKPNRFGYAPDGYLLQIEARRDSTYPPSLVGSSPHFSGKLRSPNVTKPSLISQSPAGG